MSGKRHTGIEGVDSLKSLDLIADFAADCVDEREFSYAKIGFTQEKEWYRSHIDRFGITGFSNVIDVGGAYGRWALFLSERKKKIVAVDHSRNLLQIGRNLASHFQVSNINFEEGNVENLGYASHTFDAAWHHGTMYSSHRRKVLNELNRVLKPGGRMMVGACNGLGKIVQRLGKGFERGGFDNNQCKKGVGDSRARTHVRRQVLKPVIPAIWS